jgi:hypothetical protein
MRAYPFKLPARLVVGAVLSVLFCFRPIFPTESLAQGMRLDPGGGPGYAAGSSGNLPIGTGQTEAEVIAHALTMSAVRQAMEQCVSRDYSRMASEDRASFFYNPSGTVVFLAFENPGLELPAGTAGTPLVIVGSMMNSANDIQTFVSGGLIFVDLDTAELTTGSDYPQFRATDSDFDGEDLGGAGGGRVLVSPDGLFKSHKLKRIKRYAACAGFGNATCLVNLLPIPTPWGGARSAICILLTTGGCFYTNFMSD